MLLRVGIIAAGLSTLTACKRSAPDRAQTAQHSETTRIARLTFPPFTAFPAVDTFRGRPAAVRFGSDTLAWRFRTAIRSGATSGPNFAGHLTLVTWGCGTECQVTVILDARTGEIYPQSLLTQMGTAHTTTSTLLIADPPDTAAAEYPRVDPTDCVTCGIPAAYVWRGNRLEPLGPGQHPHLSNRR